ncbi:MAG TPA: VWA domain-containing protein [Vicinamibacterales bacterium]|nr:VWA domain-containing protein [Vicinamibacterales bacterium]
MRARPIAATILSVAIGLTPMRPLGQQQPPQPVFRSGRDLISVDVVVRDRNGTIIKGLTAADFEVREDGKPQDVLTVSFEEVTDKPATAPPPVDLLAGVSEKVADIGTTTPAAAAQVVPMSPDALAGRRLIVLVFDTASMQPDDVQHAVDSANKYVDTQMSAADLVAVTTVGSMLTVLSDFTDDKSKVRSALNQLAATDGTSEPVASASTVATDEDQAAATDAAAADTTELDLFNNDIRLRALKTLAEALGPVEQKKSILYFSAGMERNGQDNQVELRAAINAAVRSNVSIYAVDTRGLQAVVPGGSASQASGRGQSLFSGRGVSQQFDRLAASQDTLVSLSADTGGQAFTDSNDFGEAFTRVQRDTSGYYLVGYSSSNPVKDGRFRRIQVRVKRDAVRVDARAGYYAERDFAHTANGDRETQLQEQLFAAVSSTDLPVLVGGGWFRLAADRYYVPVSVAVPGSAVPVTTQAGKASLDVLGAVRDEQGRPVGRFRQTVQLPPGTGPTLAGKQVLYQTGVILPPGRFSVKVVVRENASGKVGSFEAPLSVPELKQSPVKVSSVVLSTQLQPSPANTRGENPLVRDGVQLLPNLTRVISHDQKMYFYYEVYDPSTTGATAPDVQSSLTFYRKKVKVFETPMVTRIQEDVANRHAAVFQLEVPADQFTPGLYTCQINIIDKVSGKFSFPRLTFYVRPDTQAAALK